MIFVEKKNPQKPPKIIKKVKNPKRPPLQKRRKTKKIVILDNITFCCSWLLELDVT